MPLHWNKARFYKGTVGVSHGILVILIRSTKNFWKSYRDMLRIKKKEQSHSKELAKFMRKVNLNPRKKDIDEKKAKKKLGKIKKDFDQGLQDLESMFSNMDSVAREDETLLYRVMEELQGLYVKLSEIHKVRLPDHVKREMLEELYQLMEHIDHLQKHTWNVAKAHTRGFSKVSDMSIVSSYRERVRMRRQALELDHVINRIEPLKQDILRLKFASTQREINTLHDRIISILTLYHQEISDIHHIIQEAHIFTRRTEKLFRFMETEAHDIGDKALKESIHKYAKKFHKIHSDFEKMARRESMDIHLILKRTDRPEKIVPAHHVKLAA